MTQPPAPAPESSLSFVNPILTWLALATVLLIGGGGLVVAGLRWFVAIDLVRPWGQASLAGLALCIGIAVWSVADVPPLSRWIVSAVSGISLLAVLDSLDGHQHIFPTSGVFSLLWASTFLLATITVLDQHPVRHLQHWLAVAASLAMTAIFGSAAVFAIVGLVTMGEPPQGLPYLTDLGIVAGLLVRWVGQVPSRPPALNGQTQICPACGLVNIMERRTCKRCHHLLSGITSTPN